MKIKITVTKKILERSMKCGISLINIENTAENCAIALAVRDIFPKASVVYGAIYPSLLDLNLPQIPIPEEADRFIRAFDSLKHEPERRLQMSELSFEIDVPEAIIEQIGIEEAKEILKKSETLELVE